MITHARIAGAARRLLPWLLAATLLFLLLDARAPAIYPELPTRMTFRVTFPTAIKDQGEPLITTGRARDGDFLAVRYLDAKTAQFVYDVWGMGGPVSAPFALEPGKPRALEIEMPTLTTVRESKSHEKRPLRVVLDGQELLNEPVFFHRRAREEIYFAFNPLGGSCAVDAFRGELIGPDGREWRGQPPPVEGDFRRMLFAIGRRPGPVLAALAAALAVFFVSRVVLRWWETHPPEVRARSFHAAATRPPHGWFAATTLVSAVVFTAVMTGGTWRLWMQDEFGIFYDHQAASLLQGRLDVPEQALSGEAFVVDGKTYGYFGLTPALLRLPLIAVGIGFGQLTRIFLLGYFIAALAASYALLCLATHALGGPGRWPSRWATVLLLLASGLGSTFLFLGSRAYVYHEAILAGAMFALWSIWFSLRWLGGGVRRDWVGALACGLLALHARPPTGLFALCVLGTVALARALPHLRPWTWSRLRPPSGVALLAALAILTFNGVSYLKFRTFDGSPLRYSVQYTPERVANFQGKNFHLSNFHHNFDIYLVTPNYRFERRFPFFFMSSGDPGPTYLGAKIDLEEPVLALPFAMPALFTLALIGGAWGWLFALPSRRPLLVLAIGVAPMALALLTAIVTSHRYTGDFCPLLIALAAWGLAIVDAETRRLRTTALTVASGLTLVSVALTLALALFFQGESVWGVPDVQKNNYARLRERVDRAVGVTQPPPR